MNIFSWLKNVLLLKFAMPLYVHEEQWKMQTIHRDSGKKMSGHESRSEISKQPDQTKGGKALHRIAFPSPPSAPSPHDVKESP